jgi:hypothetical protein
LFSWLVFCSLALFVGLFLHFLPAYCCEGGYEAIKRAEWSTNIKSAREFWMIFLSEELHFEMKKGTPCAMEGNTLLALFRTFSVSLHFFMLGRQKW